MHCQQNIKKKKKVRNYISTLNVSPLLSTKLSTGESLLYGFYNTVNWRFRRSVVSPPIQDLEQVDEAIRTYSFQIRICYFEMCLDFLN